jgi:hypothetical protein
VREFRERIASFLESDTPVAVTKHGETLGVYVPTRRKHPKTAELSELRAAADRLAKALADVDEEELVAEFKEVRRRGRAQPVEMIVLDANILIRAAQGRCVRELIDTYAAHGVRFFAPETAFADAEKYLPPLLKKRGKHHDISDALGCLRKIIELVTPEL